MILRSRFTRSAMGYALRMSTETIGGVAATKSEHWHSVAREVRAEIARQQVKQAELAPLLGMTQQSLSQRLTGRVQFGAGELAVIAEYLGVTVGLFYGESPSRPRPGGGLPGERARGDSNTQPSDPKVASLTAARHRREQYRRAA